MNCHYWAGLVDHYGYGLLAVDGKLWKAHRVVYESEVGSIPDGLVINHLCRSRNCVNTNHMEVTTHRDNVLKGVGVGAINARKTHCSRGHEFTADNTHIYRTWRICRKCSVIKDRAKYLRKKARA